MTKPNTVNVVRTVPFVEGPSETISIVAPVDHEAARAYRLQRCAAIIEALCVVDPATGEAVPCYEPDPDKPGSYRQTEAFRRIEESDRASS